MTPRTRILCATPLKINNIYLADIKERGYLLRVSQPQNKMKTLSQKITNEANRISRQYIAILAKGNEPATLASIVEAQKFDIMDTIADGRANMSDTIEKVRQSAHSLIKMDLDASPRLAQRLVDFRAARQARDNQAAAAESRKWTSLPSIA